MTPMNKRYVVLLALLACLTGCVPVDSLNPLYTDKEIVFDESLLGEWVGPDASDTGSMKFVKEGKDAYLIVMMDNDGPNGEPKSTFYDAHLLSLSGQKFLDVLPREWSASQASYPLHVGGNRGEQKVEPQILKLGESAYIEFSVEGKGSALVAHLRNAHRFFKIMPDGKKLRLAWIDDDKLKEAVLKGTVHVGNALITTGQSKGSPSDAKNKDLVLTASTADLQKFVVDHINDDKVFTEHTDMQRRP
jgi:hypothetical protein